MTTSGREKAGDGSGVVGRPRAAEGRSLAGDPLEVTRAVWAAASWLIDYPGDDLLTRLATIKELTATLPERFRAHLDPAIDAIGSGDPFELRSRYVDTFDTRRRGCLHLTYFSYGDTRKRGLALVRIKETYRRAGLLIEDTELPDHLTVVLEFGAAHDERGAEKILLANRAGLELLRLHLADTDSPWHGVIAAVCATLPALDGSDREAVRALAENGPAEEMVGLDGYGADDMPPILRGDDCDASTGAPIGASPGGRPQIPLTVKGR
ncbi:Respiratory nitrate reductase delta chain [Actinomycetales bacterium JB111]|nr:Respiratory nitrate reductase delta chain [Actinomycetales bacterium JB111]